MDRTRTAFVVLAMGAVLTLLLWAVELTLALRALT
jgi:hypothetical protein